MGADVGKCVCAPDSRDIDSESNMNNKGEKDLLSSDSDSSYVSSSEGDGSSTSESEEESSSSSHHHHHHHHRHKKHKSKTKKKISKKKYHKHHHHKKKAQKKKYRHKKRKHHHSKYDDSSSSSSSSASSSSETGSSSDRQSSPYSSYDSSSSENANNDTGTVIFRGSNRKTSPPSQPHLVSASSREQILSKKRQKHHDRMKRKIKVIEQQRERQKMLEEQKRAYSLGMNNNDYNEHEAIMPIQPFGGLQGTFSLSQPNLKQLQDADFDTLSDHGGSTGSRRSLRSLPPLDVQDDSRQGKHPRIPSMSIDPATIQLLTNPKNVQEIFNPNPSGGFRVDVQAANAQSRSQPQSPQTAATYPQALTPTTHQYYNHNHNGAPPHHYSHSMNTNTFPNIHSFAANSPPDNMTPLVSHRRNSNPVVTRVGTGHKLYFGQTQQEQPAIPRASSLPQNNANVFDISKAAAEDNTADTPLPSTSDQDKPLQSDEFQGNISPKFTGADFNSVSNEITITNLNTMYANKKIKLHGKDPRAVPPSPPIDSVYKSLPTATLPSNLSKISESREGKEMTPDSSLQTNDSNLSTGVPRNRMSYIKLDEIQGANMVPTTSVLSSPDDDEDTVAQQWIDLHKFNIPDDKVPTAQMDHALQSISTDLSSDQDQAEEEVLSWKKKVESTNPEEILAPHSGEEEEEEEEHKDTSFSSESQQSSDVGDTMNSVIKRHSKLFRKQSFRKWEPKEISNEAHDMQKAYDFMREEQQGKELQAMQQTLNSLHEKEKRSNVTNWIAQ